MEKITLRIHIKNGKIYDFTSVVKRVAWSGDYRSPSRALEVDYIYPSIDTNFPHVDVLINSTCCFYVGGKEIFRGNAIDIDKSSDNEVNIVFKDIGNLLTLDQKSYNFKDVKVNEIAKKILKENKPPIKSQYIAPASTEITKMFIGKTGYEIIQSAYTMHSEAITGKWKYMVETKLDKINVIEKGANFLKIQFNESANLLDVSYKQNIENFVNRVVVVDKQGNKISEKVNKDLLKIYNAYITEVLEKTEKKDVTQKEIDKKFKGTEKSCSLTGIGDITCKVGTKVNVVDTHTGLVGIFYVDKDVHTWEGGRYTIKLDLNFDNVMDLRYDGADETKDEPSAESREGGYTGGNLSYQGKILTRDVINAIIMQGRKYSIMPSFIITQLWAESFWGTSNVAVKNNNWSGITWPYKGEPSVAKNKGTARPSAEGGNYVKWNSVPDFIVDYFYLFRAEGYYRIQKKTSIDSFVNGLLKPEAKANYAASSGYRGLIKSVNTSLMRTVGDKLNEIDKLVFENGVWKTGVIKSSSAGSSKGLDKVVRVAQKYLNGGINKPNFAWCCWFATKCLREAGYTPVTTTNLCDTYYLAYRKVGRLRSPNNYMPKKGDTIFFYGKYGYNRSHANHVGIVVDVSGSGESVKITTIEGNADNAVKKRTYNKYGASWTKIVGYGIN